MLDDYSLLCLFSMLPDWCVWFKGWIVLTWNSFQGAFGQDPSKDEKNITQWSWFQRNCCYCNSITILKSGKLLYKHSCSGIPLEVVQVWGSDRKLPVLVSFLIIHYLSCVNSQHHKFWSHIICDTFEFCKSTSNRIFPATAQVQQLKWVILMRIKGSYLMSIF